MGLPPLTHNIPKYCTTARESLPSLFPAFVVSVAILQICDIRLIILPLLFAYPMEGREADKDRKNELVLGDNNRVAEKKREGETFVTC